MFQRVSRSPLLSAPPLLRRLIFNTRTFQRPTFYPPLSALMPKDNILCAVAPKWVHPTEPARTRHWLLPPPPVFADCLQAESRAPPIGVQSKHREQIIVRVKMHPLLNNHSIVGRCLRSVAHLRVLANALGGGGHSPFAFCSALVIVVKGGVKLDGVWIRLVGNAEIKSFHKKLSECVFFPCINVWFLLFVFTEIWVRTSSSPSQEKPSEEPQTSKICECPFSGGGRE